LRRASSSRQTNWWLRGLAWGSLVAAFVVGLIWHEPNYPQKIATAFPGYEIRHLEQLPGNQYQLSRGDTVRKFSLASAQGYAGPMLVATEISESGRVISTRILEHKDTPGYIARFKQGPFMRQFEQQFVNTDFLLPGDIDGLTGATISSLGITNAVRAAAHIAAAQFELPKTWKLPQFHLGWKELTVTLLFIAAFANRRVPKKWKRNYDQALATISVFLIGYYLNAALSMTLIGSLLLGYIPSPQQHMLWYIMLIGTFGAILFMGRNVYCSQLCPFHQIQRWLNKLSGLNIPFSSRIKNNLKLLTNGLLWASLMLIFLSRTPVIGSYEPFSMLFSLDGVGIQWYILPLSIFGAFLVNDFWCKSLCPLGRFLGNSLELRSKAMKQVKRQRIQVREV